MARALGTFEEAAVLTNTESPFNIVGVVHLHSPPDPARLDQALQSVQNRHPLLRAHIEERDDGFAFELGENGSIPLKVLERESDTHWQRIVEAELNSPIDNSSGALMRVTFLQPGKDKQVGELILCAHHAIMDGDSALHLVEEILEHSVNGSDDLNTTSINQQSIPARSEDMFPKRYQKPRHVLHLIPFLLRQMVEETSYRLNIIGKQEPPVPKRGHCRILPARLDPAETTALTRAARKHRVSLNSVLNAALVLAVWKLRYASEPRPFRAITFANLRPYMKPAVPADRVAAYISMLRFTLKLQQGQAFWPLAKTINAKVHQSAKRGEKFLAVHMTKALMQMFLGQQKIRMGATALSYAGAVKLPDRYGDTRVTGLTGFISNLNIGPEFTAMAFLSDGALHWNNLYLDEDMTREEAGAIAEEILTILRTAGSETC